MISVGSDKNDHFLTLCPGGQLEPPVRDEKVCATKIGHFPKPREPTWTPVNPIDSACCAG